jgi:hypothetical protein
MTESRCLVTTGKNPRTTYTWNHITSLAPTVLLTYVAFHLS